ncbi:G2/mitotic-specific cyclin [Chytriomyces hyalinus]|nr:G2/mitotic-specific cyclin [Chytriomyces hyalinus]
MQRETAIRTTRSTKHLETSRAHALYPINANIEPLSQASKRPAPLASARVKRVKTVPGPPPPSILAPSNAQAAVNARAAVKARSKLDAASKNASASANLRSNNNNSRVAVVQSRPAWNQNVPNTVKKCPASVLPKHDTSSGLLSTLKPALKHSINGSIPANHRGKHVTINEGGAHEQTLRPSSSSARSASNNSLHKPSSSVSKIPLQNQPTLSKPSRSLSSSTPARKVSMPVAKRTSDDPMLLSEYANEIFIYMKQMELKTMPNPKYMDLHPILTWDMRATLVDWLATLHFKLSLLPETLFLTMNLMDRFMSLKPSVSAEKFQLVGVTAIFIACKYEEILVPSVQILVHMVGGGYTSNEILMAERFMLATLGFGIGYNGPMAFLKRCLALEGGDARLTLLARYFSEIVLLDPIFLGAPPSLVAATAVFLGKKMLNLGEWTVKHSQESGYTENQLLSCAKAMYSSCSKVSVESGLYQKFSEHKFSNVAAFVREFLANNVVN